MPDHSQTKQQRAAYLASSRFYFLLVISLSIPLYLLGAHGDHLPIATFLPLGALMAFIPMIAALVLVTRESGARGARQLLARAGLSHGQQRCISAHGAPSHADYGSHWLWHATNRGAGIAGCTIFPGRRERCVLRYVLHRRRWRGARLAGLRLSPAQEREERNQCRSHHWRNLGALARHSLCPVGPQRRLDCVAMPRHNCAARHHRLAVCEHGP